MTKSVKAWIFLIGSPPPRRLRSRLILRSKTLIKGLRSKINYTNHNSATTFSFQLTVPWFKSSIFWDVAQHKLQLPTDVTDQNIRHIFQE